MYYVYFLKSKNCKFHYIGSTANLKIRLIEHNNGKSRSTKHYAPFELISYIAVRTRKRASDLERYFKTGSGAAIANKRIFIEEKNL
jgi:putative endonuclease